MIRGCRCDKSPLSRATKVLMQSTIEDMGAGLARLSEHRTNPDGSDDTLPL